MSVLPSLLASILPASVHFKAYHIATPSVSSSALFSPLPGQKFEPTEFANHLLLLTVDAGGAAGKDEVIVFAIEVFVYTTSGLITIFVSKADSTGNLGLLRVPNGTPSVLRATSTVFLQYLIDAQPKDRRIVLSLFARAQNQYLFPGSIENVGKHVLDDRQLIKWWCRTIDPVVRSFKSQVDESARQNAATVTAEAYVVVPGCDNYETRTFFPSSARDDLASKPRWHSTHPLYLLAGVKDPKSAPPPRCLVPRFPDDPKSRFLDDLDDEIRLPESQEVGNEGRWRSVRTLEQFWEMMSYRQECSAGRLVGFVWMVLSPREFNTSPRQETTSDPPTLVPQNTSNGAVSQDDCLLPTPLPADALITPTQSFQDPSNTADEAPPSTTTTTNEPHLQSPPPSSPLLPPTEIEIGTSDALPHSAITQSPSASPLILTVDSYNALLSHLTNVLDFSTLPLAIESTEAFLALASERAGLPKASRWQGDLITGNRVLNPVPASGPAPGVQPQTKRAAADAVNVLTTGIRKKRKATTSTPGPSSDGSAAAAVPSDGADQTAASSAVQRAIPIADVINGSANEKTTEANEGGAAAERTPGVNMLAAGLVRKKQKQGDAT